MNLKGVLPFLLAVVLCGCALRPVEASGAERDLLCQFRDGHRYRVNGSRFIDEKDDAWDLGWLVAEDQRGRLTEVRFSFQEDEAHEVFALDKDYQVIWQRTLGKGEHSVPVAENVMGIAFSLRDGEPFQPVGTGMHPRLLTPLTGKKLSVLGDSVSAFSGYLPVEEGAYYSNVNFGAASMWWAVLAENTGMEICRINAVSGSGVVVPEDNRQLMGHSERCTSLSGRDGTTPDVILVLLGINDYFAGVPVSRIRQESLAMLSEIRKAYPEAAVHVCTYFPSPALNSAKLKELNSMIRGVAESAGVGLIDLEDCGILETEPQKYLIDSHLHPNEHGQILLGVRAGQQLLKGTAAP